MPRLGAVHQIRSTFSVPHETACPGDVVITPAVDRPSRDTTDLLVIAREMQRAGAGIRSLAGPYLDTTSDFAEIIFAILGVAAKFKRRRIIERTARGRAGRHSSRSNAGISR